MARKLVHERSDGSIFCDESEHVRWFDAFPKCRCGKTATGKLMGTRNENYGYHCTPCATKRIRDSEAVRQQLAAIMQPAQQDS